MSESLQAWLFAHCTSCASTSLSGNYDLSDLPFGAGKRVQILRFMTFPPSPSKATDIWALVGDRTHCLAARFSSSVVTRFQHSYPISFTSLRGALVTLTNVRVTVDRVSVAGEGRGLPYREGQWAVALDVRGMEVVGGLNEPVWFGGVRLVTSKNGVPEGEEEKWEVMQRWVRKWVRIRNLEKKAEEEKKRGKKQKTHQEEGEGEGGEAMPTPAQRRVDGGRHVLVLSSSQAVNSIPPPVVAPIEAEREVGKSQSQSQSQTQSETSLAMHAASTLQTRPPDAGATWDDFDLDAAVADVDFDMDNINVPDQWNALPASDAAPERVALVDKPEPERSAQVETQEPQTQSDLDPDESGLSDYERQSRLDRRRSRMCPPASKAEDKRKQEAIKRRRLSTSSTSTSSTSLTTNTSVSDKKRKRQQAIAALMAKIVD